MKEGKHTEIKFLPMVHLRSPFYKQIKIPGKPLLAENHGLGLISTSPEVSGISEPKEGLSICQAMLEKLLEHPDFREDPNSHIIYGPYESVTIKKPDNNTFVFRADILVSGEFPDRIKALGHELIRLSVLEAYNALPDDKHWLNLALRAPKDSYELDYCYGNEAEYALRVKEDEDRSDNITEAMVKSHTWF